MDVKTDEAAVSLLAPEDESVESPRMKFLSGNSTFSLEAAAKVPECGDEVW